MIAKHCRHMAYPDFSTRKAPGRCKAGIPFADVQLPGRSVIDGRPCSKRGRDNGATCARFAPWTAKEIAEDEAETAALIGAISRGECTCGKKLQRSGTAFACPDGCTSGFACGRNDIREDRA